MSTLISELFIENSGVSIAQRIRFPEAAPEALYGIELLHAESGELEYHTLVTGELWLAPSEKRLAVRDAVSHIVSYYLRKHGFSECGVVLFAGLGNPKTAADSLGPNISGRITVTRGLSDKLPQVHSFPVGIPRKTGFDSAELIRSLAKLAQADIIVCADSLTAVSRERLQSVIQISDVGISPGSAFSHTAEMIDRASMGVPVISLGVPMAIREDALGGIPQKNPLLVTRAESDVVSDCYATVIASGLNTAFLGNIG